VADPLSSITGLSSGVDWKGLVDQIVKLERRPADRMQASIDAIAGRKTAFNDFRTTLRKLQSAGDALRFGGAFARFTATSTGTDAAGRSVLAAAAAPSAAPGGYSVQVSQLAQAQKNAGTVGFGGPAVALGVAGALTIGTQRVEVATTDSLAAVRDKINAVQGQTGVRATLVAGRPDGGDQRLVLTAQKPGSTGAFTVADDPDTPADLTGPVPWSGPAPDPAPTSLAAALGIAVPTQPAQDAQLTVDGIAVTRPSNVVADAIPGVTLTLGALGSSQLTVERQPGAAADAVKAFVEAYNEVQKSAAAQMLPNADGSRPPLKGEPLLRAVRTGLASAITGTASLTTSAGAPNGVQPDFATFSAFGVSVQKDGSLSFDATRFDAAYQGRIDDLQAVLAERAQAVADVVGRAVNPVSGAIDARNRSLDTESARLTDRIADVDSRLDKKRQSLLTQYARFEAALGRMRAVGDSLTTQFAGLNAGNGNK
jgi:flagellar hook-associated protein 2